MGRKKGGLDFRYSSKRRFRIRWKEAVLMLLVFLAAVFAGISVFRTLKDMLGEAGTEPGEENVTPLPSVTPVGAPEGESDGVADAEATAAGPFGLWQVPAEEVEATQAPQEEEWMADFVDTRTPVNAKGIYVKAGFLSTRLDELLELLDSTELNTIVVDMKDDDGQLTCQMEGDMISRYGTVTRYAVDIRSAMKKLKEHDVYMVARVVTFKDSMLVKKAPELGIHLKDGTVYKDNSKMGWLNPLNREVLDYYVDIAANLKEFGFDEINFDYVRFPTEGRISELVLERDGEEITRIEAITAAVKYLCEQIKPMGLYVSADVFGGVIRSAPDQRSVGQDYRELSRYLDYICPMVYPSHYGNGYYGVDYPDTQPYKIVYNALLDSNKSLSGLPEGSRRAVVRPWLQDFTASYLKHYIRYGKEQVRAQIEAVYDSGQTQWLLWNAAVSYTRAALMTEEEADYAFEHRPAPTPTPVPASQQKEPTRLPNGGEYIDSPWKKE
ncbi:MAG: putative glycoside hydrolase [Lachnospiraceae bacterium]|nr:putative glycoside hydrolase [Lachnospiraceae bacterium]